MNSLISNIQVGLKKLRARYLDFIYGDLQFKSHEKLFLYRYLVLINTLLILALAAIFSATVLQVSGDADAMYSSAVLFLFGVLSIGLLLFLRGSKNRVELGTHAGVFFFTLLQLVAYYYESNIAASMPWFLLYPLVSLLLLGSLQGIIATGIFVVILLVITGQTGLMSVDIGEFPVGDYLRVYVILSLILFVVMRKLENDQKSLFQREQALHNETKKLENAQRISSTGSWILDLTANEVELSRGQQIMMGLTPGQSMSMSIKEFQSYLPEQDQKQMQIAMQEFLDNGQPIEINHNMIRADGEIRYIIGRGEPETDEKGRMVRVIGASIDITDRVLLERELQDLNRNLENRINEEVERGVEKERILFQQSRLASMGEMLNAIAHHWRQPLSGVHLIVDDIQDAYEHNQLSDEYMSASVSEARTHIQAMSTAIDDFIRFFQSSHEQFDFYLINTIEFVQKILSAQLVSHSIKLEVVCAEEDRSRCMIFGSPPDFEHALMHIINNAREAIELQRKKPQMRDYSGFIRISVFAEKRDCVVRVEDNGGGISEEISNRAFEPFYSNKKNGTGIGLYITRTIIENKMKGSVHIQNNDNGARIDIRLPIREDKQKIA